MLLMDVAIVNLKSEIRNPKSSGAISVVILGLTTLLGMWAFVYPFFIPPAAAGEAQAHASDAPLIFLLVMALSLAAIVADLETRAMDSKTVALLGVLVATNSLLRPLQGPGGFSVFLVLPMLCGYVFGGRFGFLMGSMSVLVSALFTGGVGPWMPFQMLTIGWVGLLSAALPQKIMSSIWGGRAEKWVLAGWGVVMGLMLGAVLNLWFWPYISQNADLPASQLWQPGAGLVEALQRYGAFYLATSLPFDIWRAAGNALFLLVLGPPVLRLLRRYRQRFFFIELDRFNHKGHKETKNTKISGSANAGGKNVELKL
jgi:energy-coupling factor transport system substrate-specific component